MESTSKYPTGAGIYKVTCIANNKIYIGKAVNLRKRLNKYKHSKGRCYFEKAILKHGWDSFTVEILEIVESFDKSKLEDRLMILDRETYYIDFFDSDNKTVGYNLCRYSNDTTGIPLSEAHKEKISKANSGKIRSPESRERYRQAKLGKPNSRLGTTHSEETKAKMRKAKSEEVKGKKRRPMSEETKEKIRQKNLGRPNLGRLGKKLSEEKKAEMKQARKDKLNRV
jgi:group I intron endonuclease